MMKKILLTVLFLFAATPASSQEPDATKLFPNLSLGKFGQADGASFGGSVGDQDPLKLTARYVPRSKGGVTVEVTAKLEPTWHIYSLTQPPGGPVPTKVSLKSTDRLRQVSQWTANEEPQRSVSTIYRGITVEEHEESVTFSADFDLIDANTSISDLGSIEIVWDSLACTTAGACVPYEEVLAAEWVDIAPTVTNQVTPETSRTTQATRSPREEFVKPFGIAATPASVDRFRVEDDVIAWTAKLASATAAPGTSTKLIFEAIPDKDFHVYTAAVDDASSKTNFVVSRKSGLQFGVPKTMSLAIDSQQLAGVTYHAGPVTWEIPIDVPADAKPGVKRIEGFIAYQGCTERKCALPQALAFTTELEIVTGAGVDSRPVSVDLSEATRIDVLDVAASTNWVDFDDTAAEAGIATSEGLFSFSYILVFAFLGGVILNFMPCVLPVVGLKVMSFVQQAGENRGRILRLNLVYVAGILLVFAVLAGLAVALSFSWGEQFTYFSVRLGLTLLLFALALSYLGVWEIPAPGMASSKTSVKLQNSEGYTGAFFKGAFATILATPCSGPLLGYILGLTIGLTSVQTIAVIMTVGLGMSLPYLIIGMRPSLIGFLPKPGAWMETFKQFMAFLFLGTVAFFFNGFSNDHRVPVFVSLIGVWFGCWIIGLVPAWQSMPRRMSAWLGGIAAASIIGVTAFATLVPGREDLNWEPYTEARLAQLQSQGRTVMVDFSAKWCVNCIVNLGVAIDTPPTRELVDELDIVTLYADWTDRNPEIKAKLEELQSRSIPLLAIYPGNNPAQPIVLRDLVSQEAVLEALRQAGPSVSPADRQLSRWNPSTPVRTE